MGVASATKEWDVGVTSLKMTGNSMKLKLVNLKG